MAYGKMASPIEGGMNLNDGEPGELFRTELTYDEETSLTYELGLKSSWFDRALTQTRRSFLRVQRLSQYDR